MSLNTISSGKLGIESQIPFSADVEKAGDDINAYLQGILNPSNGLDLNQYLEESIALINSDSGNTWSKEDDKLLLLGKTMSKDGIDIVDVLGKIKEIKISKTNETLITDIIAGFNLNLGTQKEGLAWSSIDDELLKKGISLLEAGNPIEEVTKYIEIIKIGQ